MRRSGSTRIRSSRGRSAWRSRTASGNTARDTVSLKPLEIAEATDVARVLIDASVQDKTGRYVDNLDARNFHVLEDGVPQVVDLAQKEELARHLCAPRRQQPEHVPPHRLRARDRQPSSPSISGRRIACWWCRSRNRIGTITGPTDDRQTISEAIGRIESRGGTAILNSLVEVSTVLSTIQGRRAVVLITDGYDEHSDKGFDEALAAMKAAQATVYVVGIGGVAGISLKGERLLKRLAAETGGRAFLPSREEELQLVDTMLASDVQKRYLVVVHPVQSDTRWQVALDRGRHRRPHPQGPGTKRATSRQNHRQCGRRSSSRSPTRIDSSSTLPSMTWWLRKTESSRRSTRSTRPSTRCRWCSRSMPAAA